MPTVIDWCDETINPLGHGCYGTGTKEKPEVCPYCYAVKLARRNMRGCELCRQFIPHTHFEQLEKLRQWKKPKTIFVQSMGDLFHDDIPDEWIDEVFNACKSAYWHRYLFLTKNPKRYIELDKNNKLPLTDIFWFGTTITNSKSEYFYSVGYNHNTFLSIEPIQDNFEEIEDVYEHRFVDWIIIGAETGNRKNKIIPEKKWIENIIKTCRTRRVSVFMKKNLSEIWQEPLIQEYPWRKK